MKNIILFLFLCFLCGLSLFGQQMTIDTLTIKKNRVFLNDSPLNHKALEKILNTCPDTKKIMEKATSNYNASMVFSCTGGFCIGYGLVNGMLGKKSGWIVAGTGVGIAIFSIPFTTAYNRHIRTAVKTYNDHVISKKPITIQVGMMSTGGVGVKLSF